MEKVVANILDALRSRDALSQAELDAIIRARSAEAHDGRRIFAKKRILPFYLKVRSQGGALWEQWQVDEALDARFVKTLQMKPRRSASGVATITVITKPWPCLNACVYCPNDKRMPKSYLSDEPACQRAERVAFHPYLQVTARLRALQQMGHATDKVELIVLGGTWLDYPRLYRTWFISELFRALNEYEDNVKAGLNELLNSHPDEPAKGPSDTDVSYIEALQNLKNLQEVNEKAHHRCVGLVVETRPDTITPETLYEIRQLGCTKIQLGVQSIQDKLLALNGRHETEEVIERSFQLARLFGFKIHAHFMLNLLGATPESDIDDYRKFATDAAYQPDEVKLYPCALVESAPLMAHYNSGAWKPYSEDELVHVLSTQLLDTPAFTRVSRMIRDISSHDIVVGNKKTNLRQMVENHLANRTSDVQEIRLREIATGTINHDDLHLDELLYTTKATDEFFLQWVTPENKIAGFLRLSLPRDHAVQTLGAQLPFGQREAMIREVHVYGFATRINDEGSSAQHHGLGRSLVERACEIACKAGYDRINVISAVGTRDYYRKLGFYDTELYQQRDLRPADGSAR